MAPLPPPPATEVPPAAAAAARVRASQSWLAMPSQSLEHSSHSQKALEHSSHSEKLNKLMLEYQRASMEQQEAQALRASHE